MTAGIRISRLLFALAFCSLGLGSIAAAEDGPTYIQDLLTDLEQLESKLVGLAEAIPEDKYAWSPGEGVRSVSQALMHTASANFFFPSQLGVKPPDSVDLANLEQIVDKAKLVDLLKQSFAHLEGALAAMDQDKLDDTMMVFGQDATVAGFLHLALTHCHEHLGQMIAYARSVGVTPPWSQGAANS